MNFNLTMKQALRMVDAISQGGFGIYSSGHFDITKEEKAELLIAAFSQNRYNKCSLLYDKLYNRHMK